MKREDGLEDDLWNRALTRGEKKGRGKEKKGSVLTRDDVGGLGKKRYDLPLVMAIKGGGEKTLPQILRESARSLEAPKKKGGQVTRFREPAEKKGRKERGNSFPLKKWGALASKGNKKGKRRPRFLARPEKKGKGGVYLTGRLTSRLSLRNTRNQRERREHFPESEKRREGRSDRAN